MARWLHTSQDRAGCGITMDRSEAALSSMMRWKGTGGQVFASRGGAFEALTGSSASFRGDRPLAIARRPSPPQSPKVCSSARGHCSGRHAVD